MAGSCSADASLYRGEVVWELNGRGGKTNSHFNAILGFKRLAQRHTMGMGGEFVLLDSMDEEAFIGILSASLRRFISHEYTGIQRGNRSINSTYHRRFGLSHAKTGFVISLPLALQMSDLGPIINIK